MIADIVETRPDVKTPEAEAPEVELRRRRFAVAEYMRMAEAELFAESERARRIEVYREPRPDGYRTVTYYAPDETLSSLAFPDMRLNVADIVGGNG